jgi:hypothetical protein
MRELVVAVAASGRTVVVKPGLYRLADCLPDEVLRERRQRKEWPLLAFTGSNNVLEMDGVVLEVDTAMRQVLRPPVHTSDLLVSGSSNLFRGLTITNRGDGISPGGAAISITGPGNELRDCTFYVRGSFPYGYGDLFGKGGADVLSHQKKSGVHITGNGTGLFGCKLYMHSFGHGYFVQQDARDVHFEDCYVEGIMRPTDEMLAETNGPAFRVGFRTVVRNRAGQNRVMPGYMKALSEDGFRTYGQHTNLTFKNCTAKNMRGGFELRSRTGVRLENCAALGCERGFWISSGAHLLRSRGDAAFGPLLFVEGDRSRAELELLPTESRFKVHALATIHGAGHQVTITPSAGDPRQSEVPILVAYGTPMMGDGMAPIPEQKASQVILRNETSMPVIIGSRAEACVISTRGRVLENKGRGIQLNRVGRQAHQ